MLSKRYESTKVEAEMSSAMCWIIVSTTCTSELEEIGC